MSARPEYRIEYQIQRKPSEGTEFEEIGFGSSGAWYRLDDALYEAETAIQRREWETEPGQPEPEEVDE